jgi:hypothetical protein
MAIRNTALGGTDWSANELGLSSTDLNDTFDSLVTKVSGLSTFWLNTFLTTVYDDFDSYGTGTFVTNTAWLATTTISGGSAVAQITAETSTEAGGSGKELKMYAVGASSAHFGTCSVETKTATANTHKSCKMKLSITSGGLSASNHVVKLTFNATDYTLVNVNGADNINVTAYPNFLIHAKGSNLYDIYAGNTRLATDVNASDPDFKISLVSGTNTDECVLYIDDVVESSGTVS